MCLFLRVQDWKDYTFFDRSTTERLVHAFIFSHLDCNNGLLLGVPEAQLTRLHNF